MATSQIPNTSTGYTATPGSDVANKVAAMSAAAENKGVAPTVTPGIVDQSKLNAAQRQVDIETAAGIAGSKAKPVLVQAPTVVTSRQAEARDAANMAAYNQANTDITTNQQKQGTQGSQTSSTSSTGTDGAQGSQTSSTTTTGAQGAQATPKTTADVVNEQLQKNMNEADAAYQDYKNQVASIMNGSFTLSPNDQARLKSIQDTIDRTVSAQQKTNAALTSATKIAGIRSGRQRYAPEVDAGIVGAAITAGTQRIADIEAQGAGLLAQARQAIDSKNMDMLDKAMTAFQQNSKMKSDAIQTMYQNTVTAANQAMEAAKFHADQQKAYEDAHKNEIQASREGTILDLISQGITDPAEIANYVNYDDQGNQVGDITFKEITDLQDALKKSKADPNKYQTVGSPDKGFMQIEYDENGRAISATTIIAPPETADELLSPSEAKELGVAYGTTKAEAAAMGIVPSDTTSGSTSQANITTDDGVHRLTFDADGNVVNDVKIGESSGSAEKQKLKSLVVSAKASLDLIKDSLKNDQAKTGLSGDYTGRAIVASGDYTNAERNLADVIGRIRSGGAITEDELGTYLAMLPGRFDSPKTVKSKLDTIDSILSPFLGDSSSTPVDTTTSLSDEDRQYIIDQGGDPDSIQSFNNVGGGTNQATKDISSTLKTFKGNIVGDFKPASTISDVKLGSKVVKVNSAVAQNLAMADKEYFAATGKHIPVSESFRTAQHQQDLYTKLHAKGARVAPVGSSFHELGLAIDVGDAWKDVKRYLNKYGFVNGLKDDMGHFSVAELQPAKQVAFGNFNQYSTDKPSRTDDLLVRGTDAAPTWRNL